MILHIKSLLLIVFYKIFNLFFNKTKTVAKNSLLLIRLDGIGDYVLFRNFIKLLKNSQRFKNYKITLLGNSLWREIAENFDNKYIDEYIWINRKKFNSDILYCINKLREITDQGYEIIINPIHSRKFYIDNIVKLINANRKIGSEGDISNITGWAKNMSDKYYTQLLEINNKTKFEFYRNKKFFEKLLNRNININRPYINNIGQIDSDIKLPNNLAVLFIGGTTDYVDKKWDVKNYARLGQFLKNKYKYEIAICGGKSDIKSAKNFNNYFSGEFYNLVGKTNLLELIKILKKCDLLISNETSAPHLAVAIGNINIFVIGNPRYYGRFSPYPEDIFKNYKLINSFTYDDNSNNSENFKPKEHIPSAQNVPFSEVKRYLDNEIPKT